MFFISFVFIVWILYIFCGLLQLFVSYGLFIDFYQATLFGTIWTLDLYSIFLLTFLYAYLAAMKHRHTFPVLLLILYGVPMLFENAQLFGNVSFSAQKLGAAHFGIVPWKVAMLWVRFLYLMQLIDLLSREWCGLVVFLWLALFGGLARPLGNRT